MATNSLNGLNFQPPVNNDKKVVKAVVIAVVVTVLVVTTVILLLFRFFPKLVGATVTNITKTEKEVTVNENGIADAVEKVYDSVIVVKTMSRGVPFATGTGFIYDKSGNTYYMMTNYHVIQGGDAVKVSFTNGLEVNVEVAGGDKYADIAILKYTTDEELTLSKMGSSQAMRVGDTVFAIGAPLDSEIYSWSVTRGVLSGKDRKVEVSTSNGSAADWIMQVLQTDAAINSGNSGGPLCNSNGEVIGVTNMKLVTTGVEGMGFAIPIEEAKSYADSLIKGENVSRPYIGISMVDASNRQYALKYNIAPTKGVLIDSVSPGSPCDQAGLQAGDIIIAMNDQEIKDVPSLRYSLYKFKIGETITVKYIRGGQTFSTQLTLRSK